MEKQQKDNTKQRKSNYKEEGIKLVTQEMIKKTFLILEWFNKYINRTLELKSKYV